MSLGPLYWRATRAVTAAPSITGWPYATVPSLAASSTWSSRTCAPSSAASFSTSIDSPTRTLYCLPPVLITAYTRRRSLLHTYLDYADPDVIHTWIAPVRAPKNAHRKSRKHTAG